MRQKEKVAVARDIKELQLVEHLIDQKRGGRPPVATVTRAQDTTEVLEPHLGENDEPEENMAGEQPPKIEDFEDNSNFEKRESEGNPFMPATKLVKSEENITVASQKVFKGPHSDIDRRVRSQTTRTYKEVFGTANEAKHKMDQIAKDSAALKSESERELKILDIKMPKGPGSAARKPTPDDPFAGVIPDHVMGAHDGAKRPELNFNGAGSAGARRSKVGKNSLNSGLGGKYAQQHMQSIQNDAMASMPGGHTEVKQTQDESAELLGETAGIATHGHTADTKAKVKAAFKKMITPPGEALTMQAIKLEEEDIVRLDKSASPQKTVEDLDKFMHMAHVKRDQSRKAWMAAKEGEAKKLYQIKQDREKAREVKMANRNKGPQMPADMLARREAPASQTPAAQAPAKEEAPASQTPAAQAPAAQAPAQDQASQDQVSGQQQQQQSEQRQSDQQQAQKSSDDQQQQQAATSADKESRDKQRKANENSRAPQQTSGHQSGDSVTAIEEQRPSKDDVASAMAKYGPGGTACKDCT